MTWFENIDSIVVTGHGPDMHFRDGAIGHGGNLTAATERFGLPVSGWLDLSTGINPNPYPIRALASESWNELPQEDDVAALLAAARNYYGATLASAVTAGPGTQAMIQWLPYLRASGRVCVLGPTYEEHAHVWRAAGHDVYEVGDLDEIGNADICVVVNPNNPDGRVLDPDSLLSLGRELRLRDGLLVVDEAFADVAPEYSLVPLVEGPGILILRSFGKFFGLPGLRLGFALGDKTVVRSLGRALGPWAVSTGAMRIGRQALLDGPWIAETCSKLAKMATDLDSALEEAGLTVLGGTALYRLVQTPHAHHIYEHLGRRGILTRPFENQPDLLRIGLPKDGAELVRLESALIDGENSVIKS